MGAMRYFACCWSPMSFSCSWLKLLREVESQIYFFLYERSLGFALVTTLMALVAGR
jgi:hypothetical protein